MEGCPAGRADISLEYGADDGSRAIYAALRGYREDGWRDHSPSRLGQAFTNFAWRGDRSEIHLDLAATDSNLNPKTSSYAVADATLLCRVNERWSIYLTADNLLASRYASFGAFSPTEDVPLTQAPGADNPRSLTPGAPRQVFAGLRLRL